jgi:hypothetical protein
MSVFDFLKKQKIKIVEKEEVKQKLTHSQELEKTISELSVAIENGDFVFPEFSSVEKEEAKSLSMKALSITRRILQLGDTHDSED